MVLKVHDLNTSQSVS